MISLYNIVKVILLMGIPALLTALVVRHLTHCSWISCAEQDFLMAYEGRLFKVMEINPTRDYVDREQTVRAEKNRYGKYQRGRRIK